MEYPTGNFESRRGRRPLAVILHRADGDWEPTVRWFLDPKSLSSAHVLIGADGRRASFVDQRDASWSANKIDLDHPPTWTLYEPGRNVNHYTLHIEFTGRPGQELTEAAYASGLLQLCEWCAEWDIPTYAPFLAPHSSIYPLHNCPGEPFPWEQFFADLQALLPSEQQPSMAVSRADFVRAARAAAWHELSGGLYPRFVSEFAISRRGWLGELGLPASGEFDFLFGSADWRGQVWLAHDAARIVYAKVGEWQRIGCLRLLPLPHV